MDWCSSKTSLQMAFDLLQKDNNIPKSHFFRHLQVRSFAKKHFPFPQLPPKDVLSTILELDPNGRRRVAKIYQMLQDIDPLSWESTRLAWEKDLDITLPEAIWQKSLKRIHTTSLCIRHGLIQFKVVHRLHYSNEKLAKLYPNINPECPRCSHNPATVGHMFWACRSLNSFWTKVFEALSYIRGVTVDPDPVIAIFGTAPSEEHFTTLQMNAIAFLTLMARRLILMQWKSVRPPSFKHWVKEVLSMIPLEKLRYSRNGSKDRFIKTWTPFIEFIENISFT